MLSHDYSSASTASVCLGFQGFKNWQVQQYRAAVDDHRLYLSRKCGRCVDWKEAELDFMTGNYYGHADEWRALYCSHMCPSRENCLLAARFREKAEKTAIHRAG